MITFNAFYSHSFDGKDYEICEKFKKIFEAFDFRIYEHKNREGESLSDEIIEHIKNKDVFIGVITKNSLWLTNEMSIAYSLKKDKMILFYEDNINTNGVISESQIRKIPFNRENFLNSLINNNILGTLYKFKENLIGEMYFPFYMFEETHSVRRIIDKDNYEIRERKTVISLNDFLKEIPYTSRAISGNDIDISAKEINFEVLENPFVKKVYLEEKRNDSQEIAIATIISPNLSKGEKITYQFKIKRKNLKKFFKEDVDIHYLSKRYPVYNGTYFQWSNTLISQPTKKFILEVEFPENYKIGKYGSFIFLNKTSNRNEDEEKRVKVKLIDRIGQQILRLEVMYPKINHNYHLYWEPPSKDEYLKRK